MFKLLNLLKKKNKETASSQTETGENTEKNTIENENSNNKKNKKRGFLKGKKRYIPLIMLIFIVFVSICGRVYFSNNRVKNILENFSKNSLKRKLEIGRLKYSILFPKLYLSDITIYNSSNFGEKENIKIDSVKVRFSVFSLFTLKLHIKEFIIDSPNIKLFTDRYGNWNIPDLPPSETKKKKPESEPFDFNKLDFLKLKVVIENIRLNNLSVNADSLSTLPNKGLYTSVHDFNFQFDLKTKRFPISSVMGVNAPKVIDNLRVNLFLNEANSEVQFKDKSTLLYSKPVLNFLVESAKTNNFNVVFNFNIEDKGFIIENKSQSVQVGTKLDIAYNADNYDLSINNISVSLFNEEILKIVVYLQNILSENIALEIDTLFANMNLDKIKPLTDVFLKDMNLGLSGIISLNTQKTKGTVEDLKNKIDLSFNRVYFSLSDTIKAENINALMNINYNFSKSVTRSDDLKINNNMTADSITIATLPAFKNLTFNFDSISSLNGLLSAVETFGDDGKTSDAIVEITELKANALKANVMLDGLLRFDDPIDLNLNVENFPLSEFTGGLARGALSLNGKIGGKLLGNIIPNLNGTIRNFSYNLNGDVSSTAQAKIAFLGNVNINTQNVSLNTFSIMLDRFFTFKIQGELESFGLNGGYINIYQTRIAPYGLKRFLSPNIKAILNGLPFEDDINIASSLKYTLSMNNSYASVTNLTKIEVTEEKYNLKDLTIKIDSDVSFGENVLANIRHFSIESATNNLLVKLVGLATPNTAKADLKYEIKLDTKSIYFPFNIETGGFFNLVGSLSKNVAKGQLLSKNFFVDMKSTGAMSLYLEDFNAETDYNFYFEKPITTHTQVTPARYTPLTKDKPNMFFKQLKVNLKITPFIDDAIRIVDFQTSFKIEGHGLTIRDLQSDLYIGGERFDDELFFMSITNNTAPKKGAIYLPWMNIDLGNFKSDSIRYDIRMLASDINLKYLLPPESRSKIDDEKLLINFTGDIAGIGVAPLNIMRFNTFFVGISKMSTEFSKFLIEMIRPLNPGISAVENIVQFGYDPNSVEFSISDNKVFTTFYFRDQNLDKPNQQKMQLIAFEGDKFGLEPMSFSDVISYLEGGK